MFPALWDWFPYVQAKASLVGIKSQDHWNPVIMNAIRLFVGFLGYPKGSAAELLNGTL